MTDVLINILLILLLVFVSVVIILFVSIAIIIIEKWREKKLEEKCSNYEETLKYGYQEMGAKNKDFLEEIEKEIKSYWRKIK